MPTENYIWAEIDDARDWFFKRCPDCEYYLNAVKLTRSAVTSPNKKSTVAISAELTA